MAASLQPPMGTEPIHNAAHQDQSWRDDPHMFQASQLFVSLIIPAYNEEHRLSATLERYIQALQARYDHQFEVIVVANGCRDMTVAVALAAAHTHPSIHVIDIQDAVGKGGAVLEGFRHAQGDYILFADADGATDAQSLLDLCHHLETYDIVIGSRRLPTSTILQPQPLLRQWLGYLFAWVVQFLFGMSYRDTQCGAKAFRRDAAKQLVDLITETRWAFDVDLLLWARALHFTIKECPVVWSDRAGSQLHPLAVSKEIVQALFRMKWHRNMNARIPRQCHPAHLSILALNWRCLHHPQAGGSEVNIFEQARRWVAQGHAVTLLSADPGRAYIRQQDEIVEGILVRRMGNRFSLYLQVAIYLLRHADQFDYIVDISNGIPFFTPLFSRIPSVLYVHHVHHHQWFREFPYPIAAFGWFLEHTVVPSIYRNHHVITVSPSTAAALVETGFDPTHIEVIYNGVEQPIPIPEISLHQQRIIYVGRIKQYKRIDLLIHAVAELLPSFPNLHLDIVGDGDALPDIRTLSERLGLSQYITLHGFVDAPTKAALLHQATVFATPSMQEGWGIAVIEANTYGCPAVAYDVPGLQVAICHNKTGLLAQSDSDFQHALSAILADPLLRERLSQEALRWSGTFTWDACAEATLRVLLTDRHARATPVFANHQFPGVSS